jgi:hypothetical protein
MQPIKSRGSAWDQGPLDNALIVTGTKQSSTLHKMSFLHLRHVSF